MYERVIHTVLQTLFPSPCYGCGTKRALACSTCLAIREPRKKPCWYCNIETGPSSICTKCRPKSIVTRVIWALPYKEQSTKELIKTFKYRNKPALGSALAKTLAHAVDDHGIPHATTVVPVPLHATRLRERGYNQAEILAKHLDRPYDATLISRVQAAPSQVLSPTKKERIRQVRGAFYAPHPHKVSGRDFLIVDDVITTGATAHEVASVLHKAGARNIYIAALARG